MFNLKKLSILLFISLLTSCIKEKNSKFTTLSGLINAINIDTIYLHTPPNYKVTGRELKTIKIIIDNNGSFNKKFIAPRGYYNLQVGIKSHSIYLNTGYNLKLNIDNKVEFSGYGSKENLFLQKRSVLNKKIADVNFYQYYSKLNEGEFLKHVDSIKKLQNDLMINSIFDDVEFKYFMKLENAVGRDHKYLNYSYSRKLIDPNYKRSSNYPHFFSELDLENEDLIEIPLFIMNLYTYASILSEKEVDSINNVTFTQLKLLKSDTTFIKNEEIRETLLYTTALFSMEHTSNLDDFYNIYSTSTKNEKLKNIVKQKYYSLKNYNAGTKAPKFQMKNQNNLLVSLDDFKGHIVYLDIWASWCKPCLKEIAPSNMLQEKLNQYNIEFVNICIETDSNIWHSIIEEKSFLGEHLIVDSEKLNIFKTNYLIESLPRYLILDEFGRVIEFNAKKPSDPKLETDLIKIATLK